MVSRDLYDAIDDGDGVWLHIAGIDPTTVFKDGETRTVTGVVEGDIFVDLDRRLRGWPEGRIDYWDAANGGEAPVLVGLDTDEDEGPEPLGEIVEWELTG
ncbi:hypothetical protein [Haloferax volcanii]|uniref:Uncharacterized protein n=1 Tax=Haloferax volcanii JCM 10717 TaxID=1227458 RepID=M0IBK5_HALVO|nr:hypothetical protein [Haloferax alexandrinus]ELZ92824.1 hypothetical protein C452_05120 [Haloferax alexandrinus JCM 10717]